MLYQSAKTPVLNCVEHSPEQSELEWNIEFIYE